MPVYLNGRFVEPQDATISVMDRGFLFGDAVYEVIRYFEGCPIDLAGHTERMDRSLRECGIEGFDPSVMGPVGEELLERHGWRDAAVYWQVSRGVAPERDHLPPDGLIPTVFATASKMPDLHECRRLRGIAAITHPDVRWRRCDIKSTNLLPNVMAKVQARDSGASEVIFHAGGYVTEGGSSNVFVVSGGRLLTPPLNDPLPILAGITRDELLAGDVNVLQQPVSLAELEAADEIFVTSRRIMVQAVTRLNGKPVGTGEVGPITTRAHEALLEKIRLEIERRDGVISAA